MKPGATVSSCLFFALFVFNTLALLSSEFSDTFNHLFMLLTRSGRIYSTFSTVILVLSMLMLLVNIVRVYRRRWLFSNTTFCVTGLIGCCAVLLLSCIVAIISRSSAVDNSLDSALLQNDMFFLKTNSNYFLSIDFFFFLIVFILLVLLPFTYRFASFDLNINSRVAKSLLILEPSIITSVFAVFSISFQPLLFNYTGSYFELGAFLVSCVSLLFVVVKERRELEFYENVNILLLCIGILVFFVCSNSILHSDFHNARMSFFAMSIMSWCSNLSLNIRRLEDSLFMRI